MGLALALRLVVSFLLVVTWALQKLLNELSFLLKAYRSVALLHFVVVLMFLYFITEFYDQFYDRVPRVI